MDKRKRKIPENEYIHIEGNKYKVAYRRSNGLPGNKYYRKLKCSVCGCDIYVDVRNIKNRHHACSKTCLRALKSTPVGFKKYKRGKECGHVMVKAPQHPNCDKAGYVPEHRLVVEKHIGRYLDRHETIHHINLIKTDNRIENLVIMASASKHFKAHGSVYKCVARLLEIGVLRYDKEKDEYIVT